MAPVKRAFVASQVYVVRLEDVGLARRGGARCPMVKNRVHYLPPK